MDTSGWNHSMADLLAMGSFLTHIWPPNAACIHWHSAEMDGILNDSLQQFVLWSSKEICKPKPKPRKNKPTRSDRYQLSRRPQNHNDYIHMRKLLSTYHKHIIANYQKKCIKLIKSDSWNILG